jgi:hypothetical protein
MLMLMPGCCSRGGSFSRAFSGLFKLPFKRRELLPGSALVNQSAAQGGSFFWDFAKVLFKRRVFLRGFSRGIQFAVQEKGVSSRVSPGLFKHLMNAGCVCRS